MSYDDMTAKLVKANEALRAELAAAQTRAEERKALAENCAKESCAKDDELAAAQSELERVRAIAARYVELMENMHEKAEKAGRVVFVDRINAWDALYLDAKALQEPTNDNRT